MKHLHPSRKRLAWTTAACLLTGLLAAPAMAQGIEGVLEKGSTHSALFVVSPESGDLIGYAFANTSAVGKRILQDCMTEMLCRVEKSSEREMANPPAQQFKDQPSGWMEITRAQGIGMASEAVYEKAADTRFGRVSVDDEERLVFKGKLVQPEVAGNNGLSIVRQYEVGSSDILLIQNTGGTACPALYHFATVTARGMTVTPEFGSCSDLIATYQEGARIRVLMPKLVSGNMSHMANDGGKQVWTKATFVFWQGKVGPAR